MQKNEQFGRLMKGMLSSIAAFEGKTAPVIDDDLARHLHVAPTTIERYRGGLLPADLSILRALAHIASERAYLNERWVEKFLRAAHYPHFAELLRDLFPGDAALPPRALTKHNLPAAPFSQFVPRVAPYAEVLEALRHRAAVVLLVGMGGMGKSSLAYEVATRCMQNEGAGVSFDVVVWVSDKERPGSTTLLAVLDEIVHTMEYSGYLTLDLPAKQRQVATLLRSLRTLVVLDNLETIADAALLAWLVRLPEPSKALVTSRELSRVLRNNTWLVELPGMTTDEAHALIEQHGRRLRLDHLLNKAVALPLVTATGGCPKALELVLGRLKYLRSLDQVLADLATAQGDIFEHLLSRAWDLLDPTAQQVLVALTLFVSSASATALSTVAAIPQLAFARALEQLVDLALITVWQTDLTSQPRYTLHPLVQVFARAKLAEQPAFEQAARERWLVWCVELTAGVGFTWNDPQRLSRLDFEHETIYAAMLWASRQGYYRETMRLASGSEYYYYVRAAWEKKLALHLLYAEAARCLGDNAEETIALALHVQLLSRQGQVAEAERFLPRLRELAAMGHPSDEAFFFFHHALGLYYVGCRDLVTAQQEWHVILHADRQLPVHMYLGARQWMATCLAQQGHLDAARQAYHQVLEESQRLGYERYVSISQLKLVIMDAAQATLTTAEQMVAAIYQKAEADEDRELLALTQSARACLFERRADAPAAHAALTEAINLYERMGLRYERDLAQEALARLG
ncbi:MAG: NB-ARC domain-containing protein [Chloroflexales bacterium]